MGNRAGSRAVLSTLCSLALTAGLFGAAPMAFADESSIAADGEAAAVFTNDEVLEYPGEIVSHCPECNGLSHNSKNGNGGISGVDAGILFGDAALEFSDKIDNANPDVADAWIGSYDGKACAFYRVQGAGSTDITFYTADGSQSKTIRVTVSDVSDDPEKRADFDHCQVITGIEISWPEDPATIDIASEEATWLSLSIDSEGSLFGGVFYNPVFTSSDPSIVDVDEGDFLVPKSVGTATITAEVTDRAHPENGTFTDSITVNVIDSSAQGDGPVKQQGTIRIDPDGGIDAGTVAVSATDEAWAAFQEKIGADPKLHIENASLSETQVAAVKNVSRGVLASWDLSLLDADDATVSLSSEDGLTLVVRMPLSDDFAAYADEEFVVYYVGDDGTIEAKKTWVESQEGSRFVCFETTHLSTYVLTVSDGAIQSLDTGTKAADALAKTGDVTGIAAVGAVLLAAGAVVLSRKCMRR